MPTKPVLELEDFQDDPEPQPNHHAPWWLRAGGGLLVLGLLLAGSFELVYAGKIYPGVSADGIYLGGLSKTAATARLTDHIKTFSGEVVTITDGDTNTRIPIAALNARYDTTVAAGLAYDFGRQGSWTARLHQQVNAILGQEVNFSSYSFEDARLTPYLLELDADVTTPVQNAALGFNDNRAEVTPAQSGTRLNLGRLVQLVSDRLSQTSASPIAAPVYHLAPDLDTAPLQAAVSQINDYVSGPITLSYSGIDRQIDQKTIISWIKVGAKPKRSFMQSHDLADLYPPPAAAELGLSSQAVTAYVADLAGGIDQTAQNAGLSMQNDQLTITQPSRNGVKLDQADADAAITAALKRPAADRQINLKLQTTVADVNETNLDSLGIKELLSEGETYFPGSPSTRLTNVRAGARRFNGVLLKPGETFSFGKILGDVGPETGYVPELVILGDHEEKQYGGGLCQVSSTAFRAALQAGLPITQRVNHSFAISYYTWPYAAPGVDATIYYPSVDFKFVNDTGHYILMQTIMQGTDLKFDFYGTKTKTGVIRGPQFVSGSNDATQPSTTVFWRDVLDLSGNVVKTDTFTTHYKSSKDFPITKQFN